MVAILLATDFRACSLPAYDAAFELASALGGKVHIVHAFMPGPTLDGPSHAMEVLEGSRDAADRAMRKLTLSQRGVGLLGETLVVLGRSTTVIQQAVDMLHPDIVVIGRHRCVSHAHRRWGAIAENLIRHRRVHVLVVPASRAEAPVCPADPLERWGSAAADQWGHERTD